MKTAIPGCLFNLMNEDIMNIENEMENYNFMLRFGFKRQLEGVAVGQLEKDLSSKTGMTIRFAKDAVEDGRQLIKSQKMLTIDYRDFWKSRLEKNNKTIFKAL